MSEELRRIRFDEFANNLARFFALVSRERETLLVENDEGERVVLRPLTISASESQLTEDDYRAFRSAFGGWSNVDTEALKAKINDCRKSSRRPANL